MVINMKKVISLLLSAAMVCSAFSAISVNAADSDLKSVTFKNKHSYINVETGETKTFSSITDTRLYGESIGQYYGTRAQDWNSVIGFNRTAADRTIFRINISDTGLAEKKIDRGEFKITVRAKYGSNLDNKTYSLYRITDADGDWTAAESENTTKSGSASYAQKARHGYTGDITFAKSADGTEAETKVNTNNSAFAPYLADSSLWEGATAAYDTTKLGTAWTGGVAMGEPGGGSYELAPVSTVKLDTTNTSSDPLKAGTLTFTIDGETLTEWAKGKNNGFIVRADSEKNDGYVGIYMSNSHSTYNKDSANAPELTVYYRDAVKLAAPENVKIDGRVITWDAAENASGYKIQLYKDGAAFGSVVTSNTTEYEIPEESITETGVYQAKVTATSSGTYIDSDESALSSTFYYYVQDGQYSFFYGQDGYTGVGDTVLWNTVGRYYFTSGIDWIMDIGTNSKGEIMRAIARFDLSGLKSGVNAGDGKLTYRINATPKSNLTLKLYKITDKDGDWQAGDSTNTSQASKATYAQKARHSYTGDITFAKAADGTAKETKVGTNHKDFSAYLADSSLWEGASAEYDKTKLGTNWAGGLGLGEPGGGSYESEPIATATIGPDSSALEFTIPADTIKEWEKSDNNGFLIKAADETVKDCYVRICAANSGGQSQQATYPRLVVSESTEETEKADITSLSVTSGGAAVSELTADISAVDINAAVKNNTNTEISPILIIALYDKNGILKNTEFKTAADAIPAGKTASISGQFAPECGFAAGDTVKFMLWSSVAEMLSYTGVKTLADANK